MMKFPQDEILNTVRRQQRSIHKQKEANDTIRNEIVEYEAQLARLDREMDAHKNDEELQRLRTQQKNLQNKLSVLVADYSAEETKRKKLEEEVSKANSRAGGLFQQSKENDDLQSRLRTMENRLDKALVRYNNNLARLAEIRAQIDELRKDRNNFRDVVRKAHSQRERKDAEISTLISDSNKAYSERDRRKMDLVRLRAAEKTDQRAFEEKLARLNQTIEGQKIAQAHPVDQAQPLPEINSQIGSQTDQQEELTNLTDQYQATIQKTLDLLQFKDVQDLFAAADELERENFSLFSFVQEHGAEKTRLQEEIDGLALQREVLSNQSNVSEEQQSKELEDVTAEIQVVDDLLSQIEEKKAKNEREFASVYTEIEEIFTLLKCQWSEAPDGKTTVTPANAMFCLSLIEVSISEVVNQIFEKARMECNLRDIKPASFLPDERSESTAVSRGHPQTRQVQEKLVGKVGDSLRPLSLEEMRALIE
jgi:chromosome segregation ATPase